MENGLIALVLVGVLQSGGVGDREAALREAAILDATTAKVLRLELEAERAKNVTLNKSLALVEKMVDRAPPRRESERVPAWAWVTIGVLAAGCAAATTAAIVEAKR